MNRKIIALMLLGISGLAGTGNALACMVLPTIAAEICIKLCDNVPNPVGKAICKLGQSEHKA
ncbi:ABC-type phosphate transport system permease subunit [Erwinia toletana]|uniref:ABC-type phosphate transport system permease subunit n=1 Tax=Winslowiella toletana TaxID=92490 RepID=A0ABS4P4U1_9GAMM|nr:hypothetical protein [Winslowiella toletana]MBP2167659.1 ABC-type phosphate transport system permease subunit [Winslowiella toletana]